MDHRPHRVEYEALAVELATHPERLKAIKDKLQRNRLTTPLFDTKLFTQHIEAAYTQMLERYHAGLPPEHIDVTNLLESSMKTFPHVGCGPKHKDQTTRGNLYMAHRCGFTQKVLTGTLQSCGFVAVAARRREHPYYDLWALATVAPMGEAELRALAGSHFPG